MAITGINSENQNMKITCQELEIAGVAFAPAAQAAAITDVTVTGVYADDDDAIELAINSILTVLRDNGLIAT